jgi:chorismate dehydratase
LGVGEMKQHEMTRKIRVGAVNYLNTKPLIFGFEQGKMADTIELSMDYPARIAAALLDDTIDIGLVPVAILPELKNYYIVGDHCIGTEGAVASVCIFSEVPIEEVTTVLMDYQSRTSVVLAQVLMKEFWKIDPVLKKATNDFRSEIKGTTAAVVIGDRALEQRSISAYHYDLGLAWKQHTGLPFVFAAWISNKPMTELFVKEFNEVNDIGLQQLDEIVRLNPYAAFDLKNYYTECISYNLTDEKREGLNAFLQKIVSS